MFLNLFLFFCQSSSETVFLCTAHGKGMCLTLFPTQRKWQFFGSDNLLSKECLLLKQRLSLPLRSVCVGKSQVKGIQSCNSWVVLQVWISSTGLTENVRLPIASKRRNFLLLAFFFKIVWQYVFVSHHYLILTKVRGVVEYYREHNSHL